MSEVKHRSALFKFFYILLTIITFPIFVIMFILRHPLWILAILCLLAGGIAYYPLSQGVRPENIFAWYQKKYQDIKFEIVTKAVESGETGLIPQMVIDEVVKTKQKMEEEKEEAARPKSVNYNENISRDKKIEEVTTDLKKRKSGFKKKNTLETSDDVDDDNLVHTDSLDTSDEVKSDNIILDDKTLSVGGLGELLGGSVSIYEKEVSEAVVNVEKNSTQGLQGEFKNNVIEQNQPDVQLHEQSGEELGKDDKVNQNVFQINIEEVPLLKGRDEVKPASVSGTIENSHDKEQKKDIGIEAVQIDAKGAQQNVGKANSVSFSKLGEISDSSVNLSDDDKMSGNQDALQNSAKDEALSDDMLHELDLF